MSLRFKEKQTQIACGHDRGSEMTLTRPKYEPTRVRPILIQFTARGQGSHLSLGSGSKCKAVGIRGVDVFTSKMKSSSGSSTSPGRSRREGCGTVQALIPATTSPDRPHSSGNAFFILVDSLGNEGVVVRGQGSKGIRRVRPRVGVDPS